MAAISRPPVDGGGPVAQCMTRGQRLVLRIFRAELTRSFAAVGFMAPFAVVEWVGPDGSRREVARTRPHKRATKSPVWNLESLGRPSDAPWPAAGLASGVPTGERLEFRVLGESIGAWAKGRPTFCGATSATLEELLGAGEKSKGGEGSESIPVHELKLRKREEVTGTLIVQALLLRQAFAPSMEWRYAPGEPSEAECSTPRMAPSAARWGSGDSICSDSTRNASLATGAQQSSPELAAVLEMGAALHDARRRGPRRQTRGVALRSAPHQELEAEQVQLVRKVGRRCRTSGRAGGAERLALTRVDPRLFEAPVARLSTSGGTAAFFRLRLRAPGPGRSPEHFVGKDLSHAEDEVNFYEQALALTAGSAAGGQAGGLGPLLGFMLDYAGVASCEAEGAQPGESSTQQLLVMRNLRDGCKRLRMLDIKIGERTADAGWQGKSKVAALKQDFLDGLTTSHIEGFRVEGFDEPPPALESLNPLLDVSGLKFHTDAKMQKKARRFMLQRMPAAEIFMHLVDVHQEPAEPPTGAAAAGCLAPSELAELALHEMCGRLIALSVACRRATVPQKWVGSSVALGFEAGCCARRDVPEAELRRAVRVNLFDWGRSELNTAERHAQMTEEERQDRAAFWRFYVGGVDRLAWEAARCYRHRFGCANGWRAIHVAIYDFDSLTDNDFLGQAALPLRPTDAAEPGAEGPGTTVALTDLRGRPVRSLWGPQATLTYSVTYRHFPERARLRGAWCVRLLAAQHLPARDRLQGTSDPFAVLTAVSEDGRFRFRQQSCVVERELNPRWDETFEVPVAADPAALHSALDAAAPGFGRAPLGTLLPPDDAGELEVEAAMRAWAERQDEAAVRLRNNAADVPVEGVAAAPYCTTAGSIATRPTIAFRPGAEKCRFTSL